MCAFSSFTFLQVSNKLWWGCAALMGRMKLRNVEQQKPALPLCRTLSAFVRVDTHRCFEATGSFQWSVRVCLCVDGGFFFWVRSQRLWSWPGFSEPWPLAAVPPVSVCLCVSVCASQLLSGAAKTLVSHHVNMPIFRASALLLSTKLWLNFSFSYNSPSAFWLCSVNQQCNNQRQDLCSSVKEHVKADSIISSRSH